MIGTVGTSHAPIRLDAGSDAVVGCGRTGCLVAWRTYDPSGRQQIVGRRISSDGRLLDGEPELLVQDAFDPRLTSNGSELLLTWREPAPPAVPFIGPFPHSDRHIPERVGQRPISGHAGTVDSWALYRWGAFHHPLR